jgi:hypothetical protein
MTPLRKMAARPGIDEPLAEEPTEGLYAMSALAA